MLPNFTAMTLDALMAFLRLIPEKDVLAGINRAATILFDYLYST